MRKFTATALVIALSFPPSFAFADANVAADIYREASEAYQNGNFKAAATLLDKAYLEDANLIYKYNQILAYMGAKNHKEALRVLDVHSEAMKSDGRFDDIDEIRAQLETTIAEKEKAEQAKLAADANNNASTNYESNEKSITPPPSTAESSSPNYVAWSLVGVGGAALVSSALFASRIFIQEENDRLKRFESEKKLSDNDEAFFKVYGSNIARGQAVAKQDAEAKTMQNRLAIASLSTGAVLVGAGLTLWLLDIPGGSTSDNGLASVKPDDSNAFQIRILPSFSSKSAGASMQLNF